MKRPMPKRARAGFTLLETLVALVIFSVLGYALGVAAEVGNDSALEVVRGTGQNRELRAATLNLATELRSSTDASISTVTLADGNHRLRFQHPITVGGAQVWGVYDRQLGNTAALQNRADWVVQYTVRDQAVNGVVEKQLVRQLLDEAFVVQREKVIATGLRGGLAAPAGFRVVQNGAVWEITLSTAGSMASNPGKSVVMHVNTRN
jgi:prepilin-type N-terminal cleavage/methylation domain-containing protein